MLDNLYSMYMQFQIHDHLSGISFIGLPGIY